VAYADDFADRCRIADESEKAIGHIAPGNRKAEPGQVRLFHSILSRVPFVSQAPWPYNRPVQFALLEHLFHHCGIGNDTGEKQAAQQVSRWKNRVFKEKSEDSITTRFILAPNMAPVRLRANLCRRSASAFATGTRGPKAERIASWPLIADASSTRLSRFPCLMAIRSRNRSSGSGERTNAVTEWPRAIACRTISSPVPPVAPRTTSFT
jgi:hypothetical protein